MVRAAMAKPPEHDFAPSWLKIPPGNLISKTSSGEQRTTGKTLYRPDQPVCSRRVPIDGFHTFSRPSYPHSGGNGHHGKDERRHYPNPSRQHSAGDLISAADYHPSLTSSNNFSHQSGFSPDTFFPNPSQYLGRFGPGSSHRGREEGYTGRGRSRAARHHSGGRQRYPSGSSNPGSKDRPTRSDQRNEGFRPRTSHSEDRGRNTEHGGIRLGKEPGGGDRGKDKGGKTNSSALSSQDFPSLSGDKNESSEKKKPLQPTGVWENRPGTTKVNIGGRSYKLTQKKTTLKDSKDSSPKAPKSSLMSPHSSVSSTTSNVTGNSLSLKLSSQASTGSPQSPSSRGIIPIKSTNGGTNTIKLKVTTTSKVSPRKPVTKESISRPVAVMTTKDKPTTPVTSISNSTSSPHMEPLSGKTSKPSPSQPLDVPSPRLIVGKSKKSDFLREICRSSTPSEGQSGSFENGDIDVENVGEAEDYNFNRASTHINDLQQNEKNLYDNGIKSVEITTSLQNGYTDSNESWEDTKPPNTSMARLSSSLEAEQRLLREMGWHEHSDNEEGYAPLTEDELKEFKLRSQQLKKNGITKIHLTDSSSSLPNNNALSHNGIQQDDDYWSCSSSSDSSEDED